MASTVRIESNARNAASPAAQHALVTIGMLLVRCGISIDLAVPETALCIRHPLLRSRSLVTALSTVTSDLIPGAGIRSVESPDFTIVIGDSPSRSGLGLRMQYSDTSFSLVSVDTRVAMSSACLPVGAYAAAASGAGEALRAVIQRLSAAAGMAVHASHLRLEPAPVPGFDLADLFPVLRSLPSQLNLGRLDFVSAGAISSAALYVLGGFDTRLGWHGRVIDGDTLANTNLNRNAMALRSQLDMFKVDALASMFPQLEPLKGLFTAGCDTVLADRVLVGVDNIASRWEVQRQWPAWLVCGATQSFEVMVSEHRRSEPCVGCVHTEPMPVPEVVPPSPSSPSGLGYCRFCT